MIPGISDVRRLPRLGKIRLGEKRISPGSGKEYPAALDHFNFKDVPWVEEVYGPACKEIDIVLPHEDRDVFFYQARMAYRKSGLFCKCDNGHTATRVRVGPSQGPPSSKVPKGQPMDPQGEEAIAEQGLGEEIDVGDMFEMPCPGEDCPFSQTTPQRFCKGVGRFIFMIPSVARFGCYEIDTSSFNSIVTLNSYIEAVRVAAGRVSMIPLKLRLIPKQAQVDGKAKTIHHLELVYGGTLQSLMGRAKALPAPVPVAAMPTVRETDTVLPDDLMPAAGATLGKIVGEDSTPPKVNLAAAKSALGAPAAPPPAPEEQAPEPEPEGTAQEPFEAEVVESPAAQPASPPRPRAPRPLARAPAPAKPAAPPTKKKLGMLF